MFIEQSMGIPYHILKEWENEMVSFMKHLRTRKFLECGAGYTRQGFVRKNVVIKVPYRLYGLVDNGME